MNERDRNYRSVVREVVVAAAAGAGYEYGQQRRKILERDREERRIEADPTPHGLKAAIRSEIRVVRRVEKTRLLKAALQGAATRAFLARHPKG